MWSVGHVFQESSYWVVTHKSHTCHIYDTFVTRGGVIFLLNPKAPILKELYNIKLDVSINGFGHWILFPCWKVQIEILLIEIVLCNTKHVGTILKDSHNGSFKIELTWHVGMLPEFLAFPNQCWSNSAIAGQIWLSANQRAQLNYHLTKF